MRDGSDGAIRRLIRKKLNVLRAESQFRSLQVAGGIQLCSNDYLGLASDPRLKDALLLAVANSGSVGSTGSRLLSGNSAEWENCETLFAEFAGTDAALYFGSGYAANVGLLSSLLNAGDIVFSDKLNHASLIDGIRLSGARKIIYPHGELQFLERVLRENRGTGGGRVIVTETIFSMEGDIAPVESLLRLARTYGAELIVDEAHATGVWGPEGRGVSAGLEIEREMLAIVHTCGKALGSAGAFVCCGNAMKDYLINHARTFIFSTAMPPYLARQIEAAVEIARHAEQERQHLQELASTLRGELIKSGFRCGASATHIVPVMLGSNQAALYVANELQRDGFAVKAVRPPTVPAGTARIRISLTSKITLGDVCRLVQALTSAYHSLPKPAAASAVHA